jgi:ACS family allantoate permease-like MFS transporter
MLSLSLLPTDSMKWTRWGMYILQVFGTLPGVSKYSPTPPFLQDHSDSPSVIWTFLPSNVAGRTKKTVTATVLFVSYCVGNAIGAQMFVASDAPKYVRGITACAVLYIVEFCGFGAWRTYCEILQLK